MAGAESKPNQPERDRLDDLIDQALRAVHTDLFESQTTCPDPSMMVNYVIGALGDEMRAAMNRHLVVCDDCHEEFLALLGPENVRRLLKGRRVTGIEHISFPEPPPRLTVKRVEEQYAWYVQQLCTERIVDPRGYRVRFFPSTFIHLAQIKNEWGHEPKNYRAAIEKIQTGDFRSRGGGRMVDHMEVTKNLESHVRRTSELPWARLIASEPTWILREVTRSPKIGTEAYVKNFGTDDCPAYRVLICKVKGSNRDVVTAFVRRRIDTNDLRNQLWPTITAA